VGGRAEVGKPVAQLGCGGDQVLVVAEREVAGVVLAVAESESSGRSN